MTCLKQTEEEKNLYYLGMREMVITKPTVAAEKALSM